MQGVAARGRGCLRLVSNPAQCLARAGIHRAARTRSALVPCFTHAAFASVAGAGSEREDAGLYTQIWMGCAWICYAQTGSQKRAPRESCRPPGEPEACGICRMGLPSLSRRFGRSSFFLPADVGHTSCTQRKEYHFKLQLGTWRCSSLGVQLRCLQVVNRSCWHQHSDRRHF